MKFMILVATLGASSIAQAETQCFACTGYVKMGRVTDSVSASGCYDVIERPDGRTVYRTNGNLDVNGTDGGQQLWSGRRLGNGTGGFFEKVRYRLVGNTFEVRATADNGSHLEIDIPDLPGEKVGAQNMELTLVKTATRDPYWHQFDRATCEKQ